MILLSILLGELLRVTGTTWSCMENQSLVTDRTWLQLVVPPQDRGVLISEYRGTEVWRYRDTEVQEYGDSARVNPELMEQGEQYH